MDEKNILLVEDEARLADVLRVGLIENGLQADVAYDGKQGFEMFGKGQYDMVILDINLPLIDGVSLCKMIREKEPGLPIMMLTAMGTLDDKIEGYDAGADDYMVKPFEFRELLMKIKVLLKWSGNQRTLSGNVLKADDLQMNLDTKEVIREGTPINLTAKEFQLLEYLLRNKNKIVSRAEIAINVWDIDFDTNTNIIDVYINYVRNKVDKPFSRKLIQTQVGMGYILKES